MPERAAESGPDPRPRPAPPVAFGGKGNEHFDLKPVRGHGSGTVTFDLPGVTVGCAEYDEGPTGCTVVTVPKKSRTAIDLRGGAIGMSGGVPYSDAICLTGGSALGLAAAPGVASELMRRNGNDAGFDTMPLVQSAVVYDLSARDNAVHPDGELGRAALRWAEEGRVPVGPVGAGRSTTVGKVVPGRGERSGQGAAFRHHGPAKVLVVVVVNAVGVVVDRHGAIVRGNCDPATGIRRHPSEEYLASLAAGASPTPEPGNTTLTVVVTNVALRDHELDQLARQVHDSMARAIHPFHTLHDGDVLFAVTTDEVPAVVAGSADSLVNCVTVGLVASEVAWDAVLTAVR